MQALEGSALGHRAGDGRWIWFGAASPVLQHHAYHLARLLGPGTTLSFAKPSKAGPPCSGAFRGSALHIHGLIRKTFIKHSLCIGHLGVAFKASHNLAPVYLLAHHRLLCLHHVGPPELSFPGNSVWWQKSRQG